MSKKYTVWMWLLQGL